MSAIYDLISMEQRRFQKQDFNFLMHQKELCNFSNLRNLCPIFDPDAKALRVGGRLGNSNLNELKKIPSSHSERVVFGSFSCSSLS